MKIQNNFTKGTINKDSDERLVAANELIDAENFFVTTTEGSNAGVGKNVPGNVKKTNYNILGGKTIGVGDDESKNRIFNFIKGTQFDYIIEYNVVTNTSETVLQATTGGVLNFKSGERILNIDVISSGEEGSDLLAWSGDSNSPRIVNINKAKTYGIDGFTDIEISVMKPSPIFAPVLNLLQIVNETHTFTSDKFLSFAYRWKYEGDFYSAISAWSKYAFIPGSFDIGFDSWENNSMVNIANAIDISFKTGTRHVVGVDILMKKSQSDIVYLVERFDKEEQVWGNDETRIFQYNDSKISRILPEDQYFRQYDNVPLAAKAQTIAGNRLMYANFEEQRDIDTVLNLEVDYISDSIGGTEENETEVLSISCGTEVSNMVDFRGIISTPNPEGYIHVDFSTNIISVDNTSNISSGMRMSIYPYITAKGISNTTQYTVTILDETDAIVYSGIGTGTTPQYFYFHILDIPNGFNHQYRIFVDSDTPFVYDNIVSSIISNTGGDIFGYLIDANNNLCKSKSNPSIPDYFGDVILSASQTIDFSNFDFNKDKTLLFSFDIQSFQEPTNTGTLSLFYVLEDDFLDLNDFFTNSLFTSNIPAYSQIFRDRFKLGSDPIIFEQGFQFSILGDIMTIKNPFYLLETTEAIDDDVAPDNKEEKYFFHKSLNFNFEASINGFLTSLHSNRDYEAGIVYLDEQGRETTVLTNKGNTVYIPHVHCIDQNRLVIETNFNPPSWAKYYKFAIKQTKNEYHTIIANMFFEEGAYRWIKLDGVNKNKVKDGDVLIVKSDLAGPLSNLIELKVLDVKVQDDDFIVGNTDLDLNLLKEPQGLYFKIKPLGIDLNYTSNTTNVYSGSKSRHNPGFETFTLPEFGTYDIGGIFIPSTVKEGSYIYVDINSDEASKGNRWFYKKAFYASRDYTTVESFFENQVAIDSEFIQFLIDHGSYRFTSDGKQFAFFTREGGYGGSGRRHTNVSITIKQNNFLVFETKPIENLGVSFFKDQNVYTITDGQHNSGDVINPNKHILTNAFNCFAFGNGVESNRVKDSFTGDFFSIDNSATNVSADAYKKINRFADITYSGVFNSNTGLNELNKFNLSLANYKDDIEKTYGPIVKIKAQDTDLDVFQEDKLSKVFYGKDALFNADGTSNLSRIEDVLGQQVTNKGEYGISYHPDSFDEYGFNSYMTDLKRGVVLKNNHNNGIFEISFQGMRDYFKKMFRDNKINHIKGQYDQFHDYFLLNIQYNDTEYVTWVYSDKDNGWLGRLKMNPEDMIRINSHLLAFKDGEVYLCNQQSNYNTFFGIETPSTFAFNFSQNPSDRKNFKNISIEGSIPTEIVLKTDNDNGYIHKEDFEKKENVYYAYVRNSNETIDTALLSCQGVGQANINGLTLEFDFDLDVAISVGDIILNSNLQVVGTILSKTSRNLVMDTINNIVDNDFVLVSKPQSIEGQSLLGYYMRVDCEFSSANAQEIFAMNSEVSKSFE